MLTKVQFTGAFSDETITEGMVMTTVAEAIDQLAGYDVLTDTEEEAVSETQTQTTISGRTVDLFKVTIKVERLDGTH